MNNKLKNEKLIMDIYNKLMTDKAINDLIKKGTIKKPYCDDDQKDCQKDEKYRKGHKFALL